MSTEGADGDSGNGKLYECPWEGCDYSSERERNVKVHHKHKHGESIANSIVKVSCSWCGASLTRQRYYVENRSGVFFCGEGECESKWKSENASGENHPGYKGGNITNSCEWCGDDYEVVPARSDTRRFCSRDCFTEWIQSSSEQFTGENAPRYSKTEVSCHHCGTKFLCAPYRLEAYENVFCGKECRQAWFSKEAPTRWQVEYTCQVCGEVDTCSESQFEGRKYCSLECRDIANSGFESVHWRGGHRIYQTLRALLPRPWDKVAEEAREISDYKCNCCGRSPGVDEQALQVHHIVPVLSGGTNGDWNLLPLCGSCHRKAEEYTRNIFDAPFVDWSDDELPDGRRRWTPDKVCTLEQSTLATFADD